MLTNYAAKISRHVRSVRNRFRRGNPRTFFPTRLLLNITHGKLRHAIMILNLKLEGKW